MTKEAVNDRTRSKAVAAQLTDKRTSIVDTTLREGLQAPGVRLSIDQSVEIARLLVRLGVQTIECGHPRISGEERARVRAVVAAAPNIDVLSHARARAEDVAAVADAGARWVGIFLGVNDVTCRSRVQHPTSTLIGMIREAVTCAKAVGLRIRYTVEDASRTKFEDLALAYGEAITAGADRICFADTVGALEPEEAARRIRELRKHFRDIPIEAHFHDDRGLALANALSAANAGATWLSSSVNGLGERCGITDTVQLIANLVHRGEWFLADPSILHSLSRRVAAYARLAPDRARPVVGENAYRHGAKLHRKAVARDRLAYAWIDPRLIGAANELVSPSLPSDPADWIVKPTIISATELKHHRKGPGNRYVMIDDRFIEDCRQYCIVRDVPPLYDYGLGHVDEHRHSVDSLFIFIGRGPGLTGFQVEVRLEEKTFSIDSPASVFIPAGVLHSYRVVRGPGLFLNHVLSGTYNASLISNSAEECAGA